MPWTQWWKSADHFGRWNHQSYEQERIRFFFRQLSFLEQRRWATRDWHYRWKRLSTFTADIFSHELLRLLPFFSPHICNCLPSGVFAMRDLCEQSVVAKYEGHLVSEDGTIQIRCTRTDILFTYRPDLNRELKKFPWSREHCASVMVTGTC